MLSLQFIYNYIMLTTMSFYIKYDPSFHSIYIVVTLLIGTLILYKRDLYFQLIKT